MYSKTKDGPKTLSVVNKNDIAWASDVTYKFKNTASLGKKWGEKQWWNMEDPDFIVWMRTAGLPSFRKLWGSMTNVKAGYYHIEVNN